MAPEVPSMEIQFGDILITLPKTISAIDTARELLDLFEETISSGWVCKYCGCTEDNACLGGCCWIAPNVCSECADEYEKEKAEMFRNVSPPARESSGNAEEKLECPDNLKDAAKKEIAKSIVPADNEDFIFQECEPFKWFNLPTFRAGKTMYHLLQGKVHIMREGYNAGNQVYTKLDDLKRLRVFGSEGLYSALKGLCANKRATITGFLREVDFSEIGTKDDEPQLTKDLPQNEVKCPKCGSTDFMSKGERKTDTKGARYMYFCKGCKSKFTSDIKVPKRKEGRKPKNEKKAEQSAPEVEQPTPAPLPAVSSTDTPQVEHEGPGSEKKAEDPEDWKYKPLGLNALTKTSGDGEKIEQEHIDELEVLERQEAS